MNKKFLLLFLFLTSCATSSNLPRLENPILPGIPAPQTEHVLWSGININGQYLYTVDQDNMNKLNNNLINILDYTRKQNTLIQYYENLNK